jgi:hypothetical protein
MFGALRDPHDDNRSGNAEGRLARAITGVSLLVTVPRLMVGEGSFTSGYADGPEAGLLAALIWIAWRSEWGAIERWQRLLTVLALALTWTKQEGAVAVAFTATACVMRAGATWRAARFAAPALAFAVCWQLWVRASGAPATMAYAWPGLSAFAARLVAIPVAYVGEALAVMTWGLFWPALTVLTCLSAPSSRRGVAIAGGVLAAGAVGLAWSTWPDVGEHARVTVPRQLIQVAPALVMLALLPLIGDHRDRDLRSNVPPLASRTATRWRTSRVA